MLAANLAELHGVDDEAGVAMSRKPHAVVLIARFVAHADAVFHHIGMAADVEDGGQRFVHLGGQVEIGRDVEAGHGLEVQLFHHVALAFQLAGLGGLERLFFRQGGQAHHVKQLSAVFRGLGLPVGSGLDLRQAVLCRDLPRLLGQVAVQQPVSQGVRRLFRERRSCKQEGR